MSRYFDANAGAPLQPEVRLALQQALARELIPNPSSIHSFGRQAKKILNEAREKIARSFGDPSASDSSRITLTSSGTEASQLAIRSVLETSFLRGEKPHWITTPVEHEATLRLVDWTRERGGSVSFLPVDESGSPIASALKELVTPQTKLLSAIWVNNETGVLSDVPALAQEAQALGIPLHLDGAQAWGKIELRLPETGASLISFSGHKIGALSGTGVLWRKSDSVRVLPLMPGAQERELRGGTENVLGIYSLQIAAQNLKPSEWDAKVRASREKLELRILQSIDGAHINGVQASRVANTSSMSFQGIERAGLVPALDLVGYAVSSGSACSSGVLGPSHVLKALGHSDGLALASIRVSLHQALEDSEIDAFVAALSRCVHRIRTSA